MKYFFLVNLKLSYMELSRSQIYLIYWLVLKGIISQDNYIGRMDIRINLSSIYICSIYIVISLLIHIFQDYIRECNYQIQLCLYQVLIKLRGSVFKKQNQKSCIQTAINDGREYFPKTLYIMLISMSVKFTPVDFYYKRGFQFFHRISRYNVIILIYMNHSATFQFFIQKEYQQMCQMKQTKSLSNFIYEVSIQQDQFKRTINQLITKNNLQQSFSLRQQYL
ncbi:unnamed protein product (macronuclear) [Paramecium tetraurelia]|uniref:Transmembrane protein n=1 Tax=Paramecium tetraurelia TaxID=5888 RepID=A0DJX2_PARTE|nr:uncharacterized protein GSPATT00017683001 [Paramecium tetraurelia]CAK83339.1 unnamed protein product [Paramecium tetraurelia]|eukprot:XP_001450736.1 hypothetical protein (macronuclear) [Paramecium tetraurelia strain d4-2]